MSKIERLNKVHPDVDHGLQRAVKATFTPEQQETLQRLKEHREQFVGMSVQERLNAGDDQVERQVNGVLDLRDGVFYRDEVEEPHDAYIDYLNQAWAEFATCTPSDLSKDLLTNYTHARSRGKGLYLYGPTGTGKSHALQVFCRDMYYRGWRDIAIARFSDMLKQLKDFEGGRVDEMLRFYQHVQVLFIDDIGVGSPSAWDQGGLEDILDERVNRKLLTYFTGNHHPDKLRDLLNASNKLAREVKLETFDGDRIRSRILRLCDGFPMMGHDRRAEA